MTHDHPAGNALLAQLHRLGIDAALIAPGVPMPTVPLAAAAAGVDPDDIVKSLLFADPGGAVVLAIASGTGRIDRRKLAAVAHTGKLAMASEQVVLARTGYPAGGVAPVLHATAFPVVIDERVMDRPVVYGGGGAEDVLLRIAPAAIVSLTGAIIASILQTGA